MLVFLIFRLALSFGLRQINVEDASSYDGEAVDTSSIPIVKHQDIGDCACDVSDQCDLYCCCDKDCPKLVTDEWANVYNYDNLTNKCLPRYSNIKESERKALRKCSEPPIEGDGSLLDWIQRTMLCISRDNNPSLGKYFEIKSKSSTSGFAETQSSLRNSFIPIEKNEDYVLQPLMTEILPEYIREVGTNRTLQSFLTQLCYDWDEDEMDDLCSNNEYNYTEPVECPNGYDFNGTTCANTNGGTVAPECPDEYDFNGTDCVLNCSDVNKTWQNISSLSMSYMEGIHNRTFQCDFKDEEHVQIHTQSENDMIRYEQIVEILNLTCTTSKSCTGIFKNYTRKSFNISDDSESSAQLLSDDPEKNITLIVSLLWPRNENARNLPRGYYFSEELINNESDPIQLDAPGASNKCNEGKMPLKFGMNIDFTCMTDLEIRHCNMTNLTNIDEQGDCNLSNLEGLQPEFGQILKVPFPADYDDDELYLDGDLPPFNYTIDDIAEKGNFSDTDNIGNEVVTLYVTGLSRSIDIFYKTVGYEHNPTHILMDINVSYSYSTSIKYLDSDFVPDYRFITLRTIVRFFEYPNNLNMFRASSANTKLQSWLPFDV